MVKLIPTLIAVLTMLSASFADPVQVWIAAHPAVAAILAGLATIISNFVTSPSQPQKPPVS